MYIFLCFCDTFKVLFHFIRKRYILTIKILHFCNICAIITKVAAEYRLLTANFTVRRKTMLDFKKLTIKDIDSLRHFFDYAKSRACDNTVGGTFMWRDFFDTHYALTHGCLVYRVNYFGKTAFSMPLGENTDTALEEIAIYCKENSIPIVFCTAAIEDVEIYRNHFGNIEVIPEPDWNDYLYSSQALAVMSGRKYNGQRNHINYFKKTYPGFSFEQITKDNVSKVKDFYKKNKLPEKKESALFLEEQQKVIEVLDNFEIYGMTGLMLKAEHDSVVAFALGEVCGDTAFIHIEKADSFVRGAYQMIVQGFAQILCEKADYINREEDVGDEGLRKSKLSYHPGKLIEKFTVIAPEK